MYRPQDQPTPQQQGGGGVLLQQQQQQLLLPSVWNVGTLVVRGMTKFARRHKIIAGSYLFGLIILLFMGSGTKLTMDQVNQYNTIMNTIDLEAEYDASHRYYQAQQAYYASRGWFFACDSLCQRNKKRMVQYQQDLEDIRAEGNARMSDAKRIVGIYSQVGVQEVKDSFWQYFYQGKRFAKRQSMWDAMFIGLRSMMHHRRDETMMEYILRVLLQVLINFSVGLLMALVIFIVGLWGIIKSYQPNPMVAVFFFISAACAAFCFVTTYLMAIYGATAGGLYGLAKLAETNQRQRLNYPQQRYYVQNRPHYN